jgi:hypothetical protein
MLLAMLVSVLGRCAPAPKPTSRAQGRVVSTVIVQNCILVEKERRKAGGRSALAATNMHRDCAPWTSAWRVSASLKNSESIVSMTRNAV